MTKYLSVLPNKKMKENIYPSPSRKCYAFPHTRGRFSASDFGCEHMFTFYRLKKKKNRISDIKAILQPKDLNSLK